MARPAKEAVVDELKDRFDRATAVVMADYRGLTASQMNKLRRELSAENVDFCVVKNTLFRRAISVDKYSEVGRTLTGPSAVAFGYGDPVVPAKLLVKAAEGLPQLEVRSGFFEGQLASPEMVQEIAKLPSREELMSQIHGSLLSPLYGTMMCLQNIAGNLTATMKAYVEKLEAAG